MWLIKFLTNKIDILQRIILFFYQYKSISVLCTTYTGPMMSHPKLAKHGHKVIRKPNDFNQLKGLRWSNLDTMTIED